MQRRDNQKKRMKRGVKKRKERKNRLRTALLIIGIAMLLGLLVYFGPRILGFVIIQQPSTSTTLLTGTFTRTTSWNSTGLVSWWKFDEGSGNITADTSSNNTGTIYRGDYTKLLLHADGTNGSTTFTDSSIYGKTVTANGQAHTDTQYQKFGTASARFDGSGDYLNLADTDDWYFGSGAFTIDFWVKRSATGSLQYLIMQGDVSISQTAENFLIRFDADNTLYTRLYSGTSAYGGSFGSAITDSNWHHVGIERNGGTLYGLIDGTFYTIDSSLGSNALNDVSREIDIAVGYGAGYTGYFNGWLDELRISKGIARWTSAFTVPSSAYSAINVESNGKWTDVAFSGKALKFDGLGDFVNATPSTALAGSNGLTVGAWFKPNRLPTATADKMNIVTQGSLASANYSFQTRIESSTVIKWGFSNGSVEKQFDVTVPAMSAGNWYYITTTWNGSSMTLYLNGANINSTSADVPSSPNTAPISVYIGGEGRLTTFFNGTIDEVKIWNRSLSSEEVWQEYKGRSGVYENWTTRTEPYACDAWTAALWHFDDSAADACGNNGGTITMTGTHDNFTSGKFGKALQLDAAGDYVTIGDSTAWDLDGNNNDTGFAIDTWVKFNGFVDGGETAFAAQYQDANSYWRFWLVSNANKDLGFRLRAGGTFHEVYADTDFTTGIWYHIAFVKDANSSSFSNWKLYVNGIPQNNTYTAGNAGTSIPNFAGSLYIGQNGIPDEYLNGTLDEFRISNKSRTPEEFREFYRQGSYRKQWDSGTSGQQWNTIAWNVSRASKFGQELKKDDSTVLLMHFNNDSSVGENYNNSNGSVIYDYSNGHNNGTLYTGIAGGTIYSSTGGKFNGAFTFDGKDDYVSIADSNDWAFGTNNFAIEFWIKLNSLGSSQTVVGQWASDANRWEFHFNSGSGSYFISPDISLYLTEGNIAGWSVRTWYHITVVRAGSIFTIYKDGTNIASTTNSGTMPDLATTLDIGRRTAALQLFNGTIDELAIYNRSLADWEIQDHFERGEETRNVWLQTRSSADNVTWTDWTGNKEIPQPYEQITNTSAGQNGTLLQLGFDDASTKTQTIGQRGYKGWDGELPYSNGNDGYTKLLLHMDGADASTEFLDSSAQGKAIVANGNAQIDTAQSKFGGGSGLFDGTGDYLNVSDSDDWNFGTGDFTIDFWVRWNALPAASGSQVLLSQIVDPNTAADLWMIQLYNNAGTHQLLFRQNEGGSVTIQVDKDTSPNLAVSTWYHVAVVRSGNSFMIFQDGNQIGTTVEDTSALANLNAVLNIGSRSGSYSVNGWLDEFRVSKGIARWTSDFDVPSMAYDDKHLAVNYITSPAKFLSAFNISKLNQLKYPTGASVDADTVLLCRFDNSYACDTGQNGTMSVDGYTKLLLHMDGTNGSTTFLDSETTPKSVTANGQAYIDTRQSKFGGSSAFFDGTGDYLNVSDSDDWYFGTGDFTIDTWVKYSDTTNAAMLAGQWVDDTHYWFVWKHGAASNNWYYIEFYDGTRKGFYYTGANTVNTGQWYHLAFVRSGVTAYIFIDGISQALTENIAFGTNDVGNLASVLTIGAEPWSTGVSNYLNGWLDEFRVSKGIARWTSNFAVPTAAYPFEFETGKYGQAAKFNANSSFITFKDSDDWNFGAGDFTVDTWVKFYGTTAGTITLVDQTLNPSNYWQATKAASNKLILQFAIGGVVKGDYIMTNAWSGLAIDTWYHLAFERTGSTAKIFIDGVSQALTENTAFGTNDVGNIAGPLYIGIDATDWTAPLNGTIDELRITKGRARTENEIYQEIVGGNLNKTAGTIAFWLKPEGWAGNDNANHVFYETDDVNNLPFARISKDTTNSLIFEMNGTKLLFDISNWTANSWQHVAFTWNSANLTLYLNGSQANKTLAPSGLGGLNLSSEMYLGSNASGREQCNCSIDDFAIYNYPKTSPKAMGYTNNTGESVVSAVGRYVEVRAIFASKDVEKTATLGTIIITAEDKILWTTPDYSGSTIITGNTMNLNIVFTDTNTHLYDIVCNITSSGGTNMWGVYVPPETLLSNTTYTLTDSVDMTGWAEGNYTTTCKVRNAK